MSDHWGYFAGLQRSYSSRIWFVKFMNFKSGPAGFNQAFIYVITVLITGCGIGILVSIVASLMVSMITALAEYQAGQGNILPMIPGVDGSLVPMGLLVVAAILIGIIRRLFNITRWHGPADSIYSAHRTDNQLDVKAGLGSSLAAFVSLGAGAPVGQYGPLVHFGATIGSYLKQLTNNQNIGVDVFIGCGVAAAIAAGFHAPIAGIVFAHEAVLRHFSFRAMTPIAIASITSEWFSTAIFGSTPIFTISVLITDLLPMVPALLASGVIFGLLAVGFMLSLFYAGNLAGNLAKKRGLTPFGLMMVAALTCGIVALFVPEIMGDGSTEISQMIGGHYAVHFLLVLLVLKLLLTSLCIGFGLFGGVFSPSLFIGAAAGGVIGKFLAFLGLAITPSLMPVVGFAAVTAAVVGAPISVVLVVLELTQSYEFAVAAMLVAVVSCFVSSLVFGHSFFDEQLRLRGIDIAQGRGNLQLMGQSISNVVSDDYVRLCADMMVADAVVAIAGEGKSEGYCLRDNGAFIGKCNLYDLITAPQDQAIKRYLMSTPIYLKDNASIMQSIEIASKFVGETIPVIDQGTGHLVGVVSEADIFEAYLATQNHVRDLEHG